MSPFHRSHGRHIARPYVNLCLPLHDVPENDMQQPLSAGFAYHLQGTLPFRPAGKILERCPTKGATILEEGMVPPFKRRIPKTWGAEGADDPGPHVAIEYFPGPNK